MGAAPSPGACWKAYSASRWNCRARPGRVINLLWAAWFAALAAANIYIAENFAESVWVNFKVFGITVAMLIFMIPQVIWLNGKTRPAPAEGS
jgi:intracellular septation protein A